MVPNITSSREIAEETWDRKEHDWTNKAFYFVNVTFILGKALGLDAKLEQLIVRFDRTVIRQKTR